MLRMGNSDAARGERMLRSRVALGSIGHSRSRWGVATAGSAQRVDARRRFVVQTLSLSSRLYR